MTVKAHRKGMTMTETVIHLPACSEDKISADLCWLTEALATTGHEISSGLLGGAYGYGSEFENDVFMMHPYCWCERDDCDWCAGCLCPDEAYHHILADGREVDGETFYDRGAFRNEGARVDKDEALLCAYCSGERKQAPNFLHKSSGTAVTWYKYIGRSMEVDLRGDWHTILSECVTSLLP